MLSISQRRGIVKLILKKDADLKLIKNWRPITLLNCDYKIATKAIASRIETLLPNLISDDQTGFVKDRFIGENIRLIDSVTIFTASRNIARLPRCRLTFHPLGRSNGLCYTETERNCRHNCKWERN